MPGFLQVKIKIKKGDIWQIVTSVKPLFACDYIQRSLSGENINKKEDVEHMYSV
jgi:hypothetical protein